MPPHSRVRAVRSWKIPFLLVLGLALSSRGSAEAPAFQLWPAVNGAAPTTYTKAAPPFQAEGKPWRFAYGPPLTVKIDATKVIHPVTPYDFGNNASWWSGKDWFLDPDRIEKAKEAGIRFWRWPGGSSSDDYHWDGNYGSHTKDHDGGDATRMTAHGQVLTDDFIDFCRKTGSEAVFTVNYGDARYNSPQDAADLAARWVKHCNLDEKFKVSYWEIGNEVYGNWEEGNKMEGKPQLTGDVYGRDLRTIAAAMKKVDPDIYIGAVICDKDDGGDWTGFHWWMRDLLPQLQGKADFLILHQYFMWPFNGSNYTNPKNEVLLGNIKELSESMDSIHGMIDKYAPAEKGIPVALTEYNLVNASPVQTIQLINGLFTAEVLGEHMKDGYAASNYWDWKNGLDGKLGGDMAMLASGDPSTPDGTPRPSYYAFALYDRAFGDEMVQADSSDPDVKVYASRFSGGELGLIIVNQSDSDKSPVFDFTGFTPQGRLMGWVLTGKDLNEKQVSWDGEAGPPGGGGPFPIDPIPPYRATFHADKPLELPIQADSVTGLVLY
jgi:hypothetical protein